LFYKSYPCCHHKQETILTKISALANHIFIMKLRSVLLISSHHFFWVVRNDVVSFFFATVPTPDYAHSRFFFWVSLFFEFLCKRLLLVSSIVVVVVSGMKPITNLQVTFRGQSYTIKDGVSTGEELTERFGQISGTPNVSTSRIVWKGQLLKPGISLSEAGVSFISKSWKFFFPAGDFLTFLPTLILVCIERYLLFILSKFVDMQVQPGDKVLILPGDRQAKVLDVLAMYLFLISNNEDEFIKMISELRNGKNGQGGEKWEAFKETLNSMGEDFQSLTANDVADNIRNGVDITYHRIRAFWDRPAFRQWLHDPDRIEEKRQVFYTNLSPNILKSLSPKFQEAVRSKEIWRREFVKIISNVLNLGDTILDGILELLLDVLKGKGSSNRHPSNPSNGGSSSYGVSSSDPRMDDPSLANNLLDELSESEEEFDNDD
jgi:hypothetical protein